MLQVEAGRRNESAGLLALLSLWLAYTRFFTALQVAHVSLPACPFYALTGHPCPFCGGTRSYAAMWRGDIAAAFRYHPLGPLLFFATFGAVGYAAWTLASGRRLSVRVPSAIWVVAGLALSLSWSLKLFWLGN